MERFGVKVQREDWQRFTVRATPYKSPGTIHVEGDASSASYFLAAGAIGHGPVRVEGVGRSSSRAMCSSPMRWRSWARQSSFGPNWIESPAGLFGPAHAIEMDCNHIPDAAMTLAVLALFADGNTTLTNIGTWRVKETDRINGHGHRVAQVWRKGGRRRRLYLRVPRLTPQAYVLTSPLIPMMITAWPCVFRWPLSAGCQCASMIRLREQDLPGLFSRLFLHPHSCQPRSSPLMDLPLPAKARWRNGLPVS